MNIRYIISAILLISIFSIYANKKMTIRNTDTGETFDASVPDGFKMDISEYNSNWLDSIPYLVEHARWKEPWAYEALAECYRYGKGGIDKSLFNAMMCYEEAGMSADKVAEAAYDSDPYDELGFLNHLMGSLSNHRLTDSEVISSIDSMPSPTPIWASFLKEILQTPIECRKDFIESKMTVETTPDEILIGFGYFAMIDANEFDKKFVGIREDYMQNTRIYGEKLPLLYDVVGRRLWRKYYDENESNDEYLVNALECMYRADRAGFLSKDNMTKILTYCEQHGKDDKIPFSDEDLARFDKICPKEYRDDVNAPAVVEEIIVVDDK